MPSMDKNLARYKLVLVHVISDDVKEVVDYVVDISGSSSKIVIVACQDRPLAEL